MPNGRLRAENEFGEIGEGRNVGERLGQFGMVEEGEADHGRGGEARSDQSVAPPLAQQQHQQHERIIFEQAGEQVERISAESPGSRCLAEGAAADDEQKDDQIAVGAFERVDRHRRQRCQPEDQHLAQRGRADHDGQRQNKHQVEAEPDRGGRTRVEKARGNREPQWRIGERPAERVARVQEVHIDPEALTPRGGKHEVAVEKRKAERFETEQLQRGEIDCVWPPSPQYRQTAKKQQRHGRDRQTVRQSSARLRRGKGEVRRSHIVGAKLRSVH